MADHAKPEMAAVETVPSSQAEAVACVLDRLSGEVKQAAAMLRGSSGHTSVMVATQGSALCDPWSVVDLVTYDLARRGIKSQFGQEADLSAAAQAAARLLEALGLHSIA